MKLPSYLDLKWRMLVCKELKISPTGTEKPRTDTGNLVQHYNQSCFPGSLAPEVEPVYLCWSQIIGKDTFVYQASTKHI